MGCYAKSFSGAIKYCRLSATAFSVPEYNTRLNTLSDLLDKEDAIHRALDAFQADVVVRGL
jgi:hypothetical protein